MTQWYIKEFSAITGLSMRSLRHYDEIGLITPSLRLKTGYRLYSSLDLARAQQVIALKSFGIELQNIKAILDDQTELPRFFNKQIILLNEKIKALQQASHLLEQLNIELKQKQSISINKIMKLIGIYSMSTTHFAQYLKEKAKLNAEQIENILVKTNKNNISALSCEEVAECQKMTLRLEDDEFRSLMSTPQPSVGNNFISQEMLETVKKVQHVFFENMKKNGYTPQRLELIKRSSQYFTQQLALAMARGDCATSTTVQNIVKEYATTTPSSFNNDSQALKDYYHAMRRNDGIRAYLDDFCPGLVDFMADAMVFYIDSKES